MEMKMPPQRHLENPHLYFLKDSMQPLTIQLNGNIIPNSKIIISIEETIESVPRTQSVSNPNSNTDIKIKNIDIEDSSVFTDMLEKFTESDNTSIKAGLFEHFSSSDISGSNSATNGNKKILEYLMSLR